MQENTLRSTIEEFANQTDAEILLLPSEFDAAILKLTSNFNTYSVLYDTEKVIEILTNEMSYEEAVEYFDFNIAGSYVGEGTPSFTVDLESFC